MRLSVISSDRQLQDLCRSVAAELPPPGGYLCVVEPDEYKSGPGIVLWDYRSDAPFQASLGAGSRQLFLVDRKDLPGFQQRAGATSAAVLLKPVSRSTLGAFLSFVWRLEEDGYPVSGEVGREHEEVLQWLIHANLKLQERDQGRVNLLHRALRDLRAPLTAICGYCDFLTAEALGPMNEEQKGALERMLRSTRRVSRVATGVHQLIAEGQAWSWMDRRKGDLRECVERALREVAPLAKQKGLEFAVDLGASEDPICFESERIDQVLIHLLDNACKFSPRGVRIEVRGYPFFWESRDQFVTARGMDRPQPDPSEPNSYRIDVCDSGAPLAPEHLRDIFDEHAPDTEHSSRSGMGLSLAICRAIVRRHMGLIWAENTVMGPQFSFVLPFQLGRCPEHPVQEVDSTEES